MKKKLFSLLLIAVMVLSSFSAVFAGTNNGVTVNPTDEGTHTYTAYQIITGDVTKEGEGANTKYIYANPAWGADVTPDSDNKVLGKTPAEFLAAYKEGSSTITKEQLADLIKTAVTGSGKSVTSTKANPGTITGLKDGYYLIADTTNPMGNDMAATDYVLISVTGDETREKTSKSDVPSFEKKVKENVKPINVTEASAVTGLNRDAGYNDVADYSIGDTVPFLLTTKVPDMSAFKLYNIMFEDTMDPGLTYNEDVTVKIGNKTLTDSEYSLTKVGNGFKLIINLKSYDAATQTSTAKFNAGDIVRVEYTGKLNENALLGNEVGNKNVAKFKFTNDPNKDSESEPTGTTPDDEVIVFTYKLDVNKYDGADTTKKLDAEFKLQATSGDHNGKWAIVADGTGDKAGKKVITGWADAEKDGSILKTGTAGLFEVCGLDDGTYSLKETKEPTGYNKLAEPITITIKAGKGAEYAFGSQTWTSKQPTDLVDHLENGSASTGTVTQGVANNKGTTLPETGGMGTTIIYILGAALVIGAGVVLVSRKKVDNR